MKVRVGCEFVHRVDNPTHAVVQVEPRLGEPFRVVEEQWGSSPDLPSKRFVDGFGNRCRRVTLPPGPSTLRYHAVVEVARDPDPSAPDAVEVPPQDLPDEALAFTLPSRFCPSDELSDTAWELFGQEGPGWSRVQAICDWVHDEVKFGYGNSTSVTTAADVLASRAGVCRDFTHLGVAFCRSFNIPTRYVAGYLPDIGVPPPDMPMDFCAWMEVYLGGQWWTFDPRNNKPRVGRVVIARGRDALDVAMLTTFGPTDLQSMVVEADEVSV